MKKPASQIRETIDMLDHCTICQGYTLHEVMNPEATKCRYCQVVKVITPSGIPEIGYRTKPTVATAQEIYRRMSDADRMLVARSGHGGDGAPTLIGRYQDIGGDERPMMALRRIEPMPHRIDKIGFQFPGKCPICETIQPHEMVERARLTCLTCDARTVLDYDSIFPALDVPVAICDAMLAAALINTRMEWHIVGVGGRFASGITVEGKLVPITSPTVREKLARSKR